MNNRYQTIVVWNDCTSKSEGSNDLNAVLGAVQIYYSTGEIARITVYDTILQRDILDFNP